MKKYLLKRLKCIIWIFFIIILVDLISCVGHLENIYQDNNSYQLSIYLTSIDYTSSKNLSFNIDKINIVDDKGVSSPFLDNLSKKIDSKKIINKQLSLGEVYVRAGHYKGIKLQLSDIILIEGGKSVDLPTPDDEIYIPYDFNICKKECASIFLILDIDSSIKRISHGYLFSPKFTIKKQTLHLKRVTGYVSNKNSNTVSIIDRNNNELVDVITVGKGPGAMIISPDGDKLYVANTISNTISVIDTNTNEVIYEIYNSQGANPVDLVISERGDIIYVANYDSNNVGVIDTFSKNVLLVIPVGYSPVRMALNPNRDPSYPAYNELYVTNFNSSTISIIDTYYHRNTGRKIHTGANPYGIAVNSDGDTIYVVNNGSTKLQVIGWNEKEGNNPVWKVIDQKNIFIDYGSNDLILDSRDDIIYVINKTRNNMKAISLFSNITTMDINTGFEPSGFMLDEEEKKIFIANNGSNTVSVIDLISERIIKEIPVGNSPQRVVFKTD